MLKSALHHRSLPRNRHVQAERPRRHIAVHQLLEVAVAPTQTVLHQLLVHEILVDHKMPPCALLVVSIFSN